MPQPGSTGSAQPSDNDRAEPSPLMPDSYTNPARSSIDA